jgi:glycosyltransferase involved in cell wall biosynthesis
MTALHTLAGTWRSRVTLYIALTEFARNKFVEGGLPADRITIKPNFVPLDLGVGGGAGDYLIYVGRLSEEKGIIPLIEAWRRVQSRGRLLIAGDGPLLEAVKSAAEQSPSIEFLGTQPLRHVYELMGDARALVLPSVCYEGMPRTVIEAFSRGTPVISSRHGAMREMIREGETGWLVEPGDVGELTGALEAVLGQRSDVANMRRLARMEYEWKYTAKRNLELLIGTYNRAIELNAAGDVQRQSPKVHQPADADRV